MRRTRLVSACLLSLLLSLAACLFFPNVAALAEETAQQRDDRMGWWRDARFGMFIHFGLYSHAAGYWDGKPVPWLCSWTLHTTKVPLEEYLPLKDQFNPTQFDADEIVRLAKAAGMKYIVITTRHHEGFSLFDTEYSDFDVMATPLKRDLMKEMAEACRKHDMPLGWYYSILDWYHPDYTPRRPGDDRPTEDADYERYMRFMKDQLRELLTKYGKIDILWFDGSWDPTFTNERGLDLYKYVLSLQPTIVINNRLGHGDNRPGDFGTPEQTIPDANSDGKDWETCMTINDTWGFKRQDDNWKSAQTMIRMLADCASKGGNFLLNIGPAPDGTIPRPSVERLEEMGRWMEVNGESVYGTKAGPYRRRLPWGCVSRKDLDNGRVRLFVHVFDWPKEGELVIPRIVNKPVGAYLLVDPAKTPLAVRQETIDGENVIRVQTGAVAPSEHNSVVVLDIEGEPELTLYRIKPGADGTLELPAADADLHGHVIRYDAAPGRESVGHWVDAKEWISWPVRIKRPGIYQVEITYGCAPEGGGGAYSVEVAGQRLEGETSETKGWFDRRTDVVGRISIDETGDRTVALRCLRIDKGRAAALDFQKLVMKPVEGGVSTD